MSTRRTSLAWLLTLTLVFCASGGAGAVHAQRLPECKDGPVVRPVPPAPVPSIRPNILGVPPIARTPPKPTWEPPVIRPLPPIGSDAPPWSVILPTEIPPEEAPPATPSIFDQTTVISPILTEPSSRPRIALSPAIKLELEPPAYDVADEVINYSAYPVEPSRTSLRRVIEAGRHRVNLVTFTGDSKPASYYSNTIHIHESNRVTQRDLDRITQVSDGFLAALGDGLLADPSLSGARFVTMAQTDTGEFLTIYDVANDGKFGAVVVNLSAPAPRCEGGGCTMADVFREVVGPWLEQAPGGRLYMIGDDLERISPTEIGGLCDCDVIRRPARLQKSIPQTESRLAQLQDRVLEGGRTVYLNGLPRGVAEAVRSGYQRDQAAELQQTAEGMDALAEGFLGTRMLRRFLARDLRDLFIQDESDVVIILAHSDKDHIFVNGVPVSTEEINSYPARVAASPRPRVCILLSCYGGDFKITKGVWRFKRGIDSLAEVLVGKGYFDKVIAPSGEITPRQATLFLGDYFSRKPIRRIAAERYPQLLQIADNREAPHRPAR